MDATIRPLALHDVDHVVALSLRAWAPVFDSIAATVGRDIFRHLYRPDWRTYQEADVRRACSTYEVSVAEVDGAVVGFVAVDLPPDDPQGEIYMLAVDPGHQRRGIGSRLTDVAVERLRQAGRQVAVVGTGGDPGHAPARATYRRAGFTSLPIEQYYLLL